MLDIDATTKLSGPMFNGEAARRVDDATERAERTVAEYGAVQVRQRLGQVLQHPTGQYMSRISVVTQGAAHVVSDRDSVYGPWLEGTGSRNKTTRFKGYRTFRYVAQRVESQAGPITERIIEQTTSRL